jgi:hypothetical protein
MMKSRDCSGLNRNQDHVAGRAGRIERPTVEQAVANPTGREIQMLAGAVAPNDRTEKRLAPE